MENPNLKNTTFLHFLHFSVKIHKERSTEKTKKSPFLTLFFDPFGHFWPESPARGRGFRQMSRNMLICTKIGYFAPKGGPGLHIPPHMPMQGHPGALSMRYTARGWDPGTGPVLTHRVGQRQRCTSPDQKCSPGFFGF